MRTEMIREWDEKLIWEYFTDNAGKCGFYLTVLGAIEGYKTWGNIVRCASKNFSGQQFRPEDGLDELGDQTESNTIVQESDYRCLTQGRDN